MKQFLAVALMAVICAVVKSEEEFCHNNVVSACSSTTLGAHCKSNLEDNVEFNELKLPHILPHVALTGMFSSETPALCNARYGGIDHIEPEMQAYINSQLTKSYEYLLMSTHFNSYQKNRPGFQKLYQAFSDRSFDDTITLIKELTRRGGKVDFNTRHESPASVSKQNLKLEVDELHSLGLALDNEKQLAKGAMHVHTRALHATERDPEIAHFIEEKFLPSQAETIRKLSGYANDLSKMMNNPDPSLSVYLFDEYLQKQ